MCSNRGPYWLLTLLNHLWILILRQWLNSLRLRLFKHFHQWMLDKYVNGRKNLEYPLTKKNDWRPFGVWPHQQKIRRPKHHVSNDSSFLFSFDSDVIGIEFVSSAILHSPLLRRFVLFRFYSTFKQSVTGSKEVAGHRELAGEVVTINSASRKDF